jgi:hypothetical protein
MVSDTGPRLYFGNLSDNLWLIVVDSGCNALCSTLAEDRRPSLLVFNLFLLLEACVAVSLIAHDRGQRTLHSFLTAGGAR